MKRFSILVLTLAAALGACAHKKAAPACPDGLKVPVWRPLITEADFDRWRTQRQSFVDGLAKAKAGGGADAIAHDEALFDPDRSQPDPFPPAGHYRCRAYKLGAAGPATHDFTIDAPAPCEIAREDDAWRFTVTGGPQRPTGLLYPDDPSRAAFLGTLVLGDETVAMRYGQDTQRDVVGALDRIGAKRWRLTLPYPHFESTLELIEITPG